MGKWSLSRIGGALSTGGLTEVLGKGDDINRAQDSLMGKSSSPVLPSSGIDSNKWREGVSEGEQKAAQLYGQDASAVGSNVQDILKMRRRNLDGQGPQADYLRQQRNSQIRMAKAAGASPEEIAQINRSAGADIGNSQFQQNMQNLNSYQDIVGNMLSGQQSTALGYGSLAAGNQYIAPPTTGGGGLLGGGGTVICTELYKQGYMSKEIYKKDQLYGYRMMTYHPEVYWGYRIMAKPIVKLMKKSKLFTKLISIPASVWAQDMAGYKSYTGRVINVIGTAICGKIGEYYGKDRNKKKEATC